MYVTITGQLPSSSYYVILILIHVQSYYIYLLCFCQIQIVSFLIKKNLIFLLRFQRGGGVASLIFSPKIATGWYIIRNERNIIIVLRIENYTPKYARCFEIQHSRIWLVAKGSHGYCVPSPVVKLCDIIDLHCTNTRGKYRKSTSATECIYNSGFNYKF